MRDDVLERLALDLLAPELDIPLDIGGGQLAEPLVARNAARQEVAQRGVMLLDRSGREPAQLGKLLAVIRTKRRESIVRLGEVEPSSLLQEARERALCSAVQRREPRRGECRVPIVPR